MRTHIFLLFISVLFLCAVQQKMHKAVASQKDAVNQLGKDLDLTEQACSSLKQNFCEYCPDICRQETDVKHLKNRFTNVNNQIQER